MKRQLEHYGSPALLILLALVAWQLAYSAFDIASYVVPPPLDILDVLVDERELLATNLWVTAKEVMLGFGAAVVVGALVAILLHLSPVARRAIYPLLVVSQTIPIVVFAPVLVITLGFGILPKLVIIALICFFPIVVSMVNGLESVDQSLKNMMRSLYGTRAKILWRVELPGALPETFSGVRIAATYATIGAVFAEWSGSSEGLGFVIQQSTAALETDLTFAATVLLCVLAFALVLVVVVVERLVIPWAPRFAESR